MKVSGTMRFQRFTGDSDILLGNYGNLLHYYRINTEYGIQYLLST